MPIFLPAINAFNVLCILHGHMHRKDRERERANDNVCERRIFTDKKCNYANDVVGTVILVVVVDDYINDKKPRK